MRFSVFVILVVVLSQACVSSHVFEDAQVVGKGNSAVEGSMSRAVFKPLATSNDGIGLFYRNETIGTLRASFVYGITDRLEVGTTLDLPVGLHSKIKYQIPWKSIRHIHAVKGDAYLPIFYYIQAPAREFPEVILSPTYIYTYRHDDLLSMTTNATMMGVKTQERWAYIPGVSWGFHVGDEVRFSAGISYFDNFGKLGSTRIQYLTVEAGIKYDL